MGKHLDLNGKVALVTGASSGIGRATAVEVKLELRARSAARHERIGQPGRLEHLECPRLHGDGSRLVRPVERAVHDAERNSERRELRRERQPRRAGADDEDGKRRIAHVEDSTGGARVVKRGESVKW